MERKEFEQVLKRALELQSLQKTEPEESFALEDLHSAASRLGIAPEILDQAVRETRKQFKKFHFSDSPDQVREAFLKHFLMSETHSGPGMSMVRIDHSSIRPGSNSPIRVYHPMAKEVDAYIEFAATPEGGTNVTWSGNREMRTRTKVLVGGWPVLILIPMITLAMAKGVALLSMLPITLILFLSSIIMLWGIKHNATMLESSLSQYFQNCQTLDEIGNQKQLKVELEQLREKAAARPVMDDSILRAPMPELNEESTAGQADETRPPANRQIE